MTGSSGIVASCSGGRLLLLLTWFYSNWDVMITRVAKITLHAERGLSVLAVDPHGCILPGSPEMDELN